MRKRVVQENNKMPRKEPQDQPIIITLTRLKYIVATIFVIVIVQICIIKYFFLDRLESTQPIEERTPWEAIKLLLRSSAKVGLPVFVLEPNLIRAVREGSKKRVDLWNMEPQVSVTIGVQETDIDLLHRVVSAMQRKGYNFWEKEDEDPRGVFSATDRTYKVITTHMLLWVPVSSHTPMLIHLVVFFERHGFYWHGAVQDKLHQPPFDLSKSLFGRTTGSYSLFGLTTVYVDGVKVQFPEEPSAFFREIKASEFIECNHTQSHFFMTHYGIQNKDETFITFQRKARQLLSITKKTLNLLGIPFWLSSGTCLGWFRQCDLIPYTTDVDIGIFIKDYQPTLVSAFESEGLMLTHFFGQVSDSLELSFLYGDLKLDIFFFYVTDEYIWNGGTQASTGNKYKYIFPHFHLCWTEFLDLSVQVPCPTLPYIKANYGANWMIPYRYWDWKKSPNNVIENGQWPEEEWDDVIQLYS